MRQAPVADEDLDVLAEAGGAGAGEHDEAAAVRRGLDHGVRGARCGAESGAGHERGLLIFTGDGDEEGFTERRPRVGARALFRHAGSADAGIVAWDVRDGDARGIRGLDRQPRAVELTAGQVGECRDRGELPLVLAAVDGLELVDVDRAEPLGAGLNGHEGTIGVRDETVLPGSGQIG